MRTNSEKARQTLAWPKVMTNNKSSTKRAIDDASNKLRNKKHKHIFNKQPNNIFTLYFTEINNFYP